MLETYDHIIIIADVSEIEQAQKFIFKYFEVKYSLNGKKVKKISYKTLFFIRKDENLLTTARYDSFVLTSAYDDFKVLNFKQISRISKFKNIK